MTCTRSKEVIHLRIFGPLELLVGLNSYSRIELNLLQELIAGWSVLNFEVEARIEVGGQLIISCARVSLYRPSA